MTTSSSAAPGASDPPRRGLGPVLAATADLGITDEQRRQGLRRMRTVALSLLVLAAVVYVVTIDRGGAWGYVHATAEASMVGAIADWFAVTALFRHPLGIPIPHTAIIPTRKLSLARSLRDFITDNFLAEAVIRSRVADAEVSRRIGEWVTRPGNSERVVNEVATLAHAALQRVRDEDVAALVEEELLPRLRDEPVSELLGRLLREVVDEGAHHGLVDLALSEAYRWLSTHQDAVAEALSTRAPWWTPQWLDERVTQRVHHEAVAWVRDIRDDPDHEARRALDDFLRQLAGDLQADPDTIDRAERLKQRILGQRQVVTSLTSLWHVLRQALVNTLRDPDSQLRSRGAASLTSLGHRLVDDPTLRERVDRHAADAAVYLVGRYGKELTTVITDTVDRWDGREAARRIELHVGRDLQFIRINGTIVGGLAGLLIYTFTRLA